MITGAVFQGQARYGYSPLRGHDTFGWCPTSSTVEYDDDGVYIRSWCKLDTWRRLQDPTDSIWLRGHVDSLVRLREDRWFKEGENVRAWHELQLSDVLREPVYRPGDWHGMDRVCGDRSDVVRAADHVGPNANVETDRIQEDAALGGRDSL